MANNTQEQEIQLVVFTLGEEEFACEIKSVAEVLKMVKVTPLPRSVEFIEGVINMRGEVIPVLDLRKRFNLADMDRTTENRIIIVEVNDRLFGLIVDSVSEVSRLPHKQIQDTPEGVAGERNNLIKGVGKVDQRMLIILNIDELLSAHEKNPLDDIARET